MKSALWGAVQGMRQADQDRRTTEEHDLRMPALRMQNEAASMRNDSSKLAAQDEKDRRAALATHTDGNGNALTPGMVQGLQDVGGYEAKKSEIARVNALNNFEPYFKGYMTTKDPSHLADFMTEHMDDGHTYMTKQGADGKVLLYRDGYDNAPATFESADHMAETIGYMLHEPQTWLNATAASRKDKATADRKLQDQKALEGVKHNYSMAEQAAKPVLVPEGYAMVQGQDGEGNVNVAFANPKSQTSKAGEIQLADGSKVTISQLKTVYQQMNNLPDEFTLVMWENSADENVRARAADARRRMLDAVPFEQFVQEVKANGLPWDKGQSRPATKPLPGVGGKIASGESWEDYMPNKGG